MQRKLEVVLDTDISYVRLDTRTLRTLEAGVVLQSSWNMFRRLRSDKKLPKVPTPRPAPVAWAGPAMRISASA